MFARRKNALAYFVKGIATKKKRFYNIFVAASVTDFHGTNELD
jgi:hypothetical protein